MEDMERRMKERGQSQKVVWKKAADGSGIFQPVSKPGLNPICVEPYVTYTGRRPAANLREEGGRKKAE